MGTPEPKQTFWMESGLKLLVSGRSRLRDEGVGEEIRVRARAIENE